MSKTFAEEIRDTLAEEMRIDSSIVVIGLGVNDPKGVFGTTLGLAQEFGKNRVIEAPTSENAVLGICVGLAMAGHKVVNVHQRLDFFLLAMDQLVNSAAKWNFMFGNQTPIPITVRLILGRGWGQGPTHSQNLHLFFSHIPGIRVYMPSLARDVRPLLRESITFQGPSIFLEDRWLHNQRFDEYRDSVASENLKGLHRVVRSGSEVTIISSGFLLIESMRAANALEEHDISVQVIDLRVLKPLDYEFLLKKTKETKHIFVVDAGPSFGNYGKEIAYTLNLVHQHKVEPVKVISERDAHEPTSHGVIADFKVNARSIAGQIFEVVRPSDLCPNFDTLSSEIPDVPDESFRGPF